MSDQDKLGIFIACLSIGISLICFLGRDLLWEYEFWWRKKRGFPPEALEKTSGDDEFVQIIGWICVAYAVLVLLYVGMT